MRPAPDAPPLSPAEVDRLVEELKKDVDRTLIRENFKLTVEERLIQLMRLQEFAEELTAGRPRYLRLMTDFPGLLRTLQREQVRFIVIGSARRQLTVWLD